MNEKIVAAILGAFSGITGIAYGKEILVFIISLFPILELRGGLIAAAVLGVKYIPALIISVVGNIIPVPFILLFINAIIGWMRKSKVKLFNKFVGWLDGKVEKHRGQLDKYGYLGLILFVGIPLPGTGAWTGCLVASVLELDRKKSFLCCMAGIALAATIMSFITYGLPLIISMIF